MDFVSTPIPEDGKKTNNGADNDLWKLLRKGDRCCATSHGIRITGYVARIMKLSNGRVLFSVCAPDGTNLGLFDVDRITPADEDMVRENMTRLDLLLRRYEPRGMSTATAVW
jgi:hypothetical protein